MTTDDRLEKLPEPLRKALPDLMRRAIDAAKRADAPFGCVLADYNTGKFLDEAPNTSSSDPTAHAEMNGLRMLAAKHLEPSKTALISTAEPCPMCATACFWAQIPVVVFGTSIETLIRKGWRQIDFSMDKLLSHAKPKSDLVVVADYLSSETDRLYDKKA